MEDSYKLIINGLNPLQGETYVSGGKNTSLPVIAAALLCNEPCVLENIPDLEDIHASLDIIRYLGATAEFDNAAHRLYIDPRSLNGTSVPKLMADRFRASYYFMGVLLGRFGEAHVAYPGGCDIGNRPLDQHLKGFRALGADVDDREGFIHAHGKLTGGHVFFDRITVGGTINVMLAAAKASGNTVLHNAAREPHIVDLANFLNSMGCPVRGAGTDTIRIRGVSKLHGSTYTVIPDQIETGTLMIAAAATRGDVVIRGCIPTHMEALTAKLLEMGVMVSEGDDVIQIHTVAAHRSVNVKTLEYPGFPTDLQQPMSAMLTRAKGISYVTETIFENRFRHMAELARMGARYHIVDQTAIIEGVEELHGAPVTCTDLRAGAALVVAGLMARGTTEILNPAYIERGYERFAEKLRALGADIRKEPV